MCVYVCIVQSARLSESLQSKSTALSTKRDELDASCRGCQLLTDDVTQLQRQRDEYKIEADEFRGTADEYKSEIERYKTELDEQLRQREQLELEMKAQMEKVVDLENSLCTACLLYTSPSPRD